MCPNRTDREFTHMRYSAATCDPNDFKDSGFTLRQVHYEPPRRTELFIVMTMYNEDEGLFCRTMDGVIKNVAHLCSRDRSKTWGKDGWTKVVVCIVSDGRAKINSRTLSVIAAMGAYQEGIAKNIVNGKAVTAHIYEYTTQSEWVSRSVFFWLTVSQYPSHRPSRLKRRTKASFPFKSFSVSRRRIKRRSTLTAGSSTPLGPSCSRMCAYCST